MATVNEVLNSEKSSTTAFIPGEDYMPIIDGHTYLGHIVNAKSRIVSTHGGLHKAKVYSYFVEISPENKINKYPYKNKEGEDKTVLGDKFAGRKVLGLSVFKFLDPVEGETYTGNPEGNKRYFKFCEAFGVMPKEVEQQIDGTPVTVKMLPDLDVDMLNGKPVEAFIGLGKDWTDKTGKTRKGKEVKFVNKREEGSTKTVTEPAPKPQTVTEDDLPF